MKTWQAALLVLVLWGVLRLGAGDPILSAAEVDALNAGTDLAEVLTGEEGGGLKSRLMDGFATHEGNPRVGMLPKHQPWRHAVVEPPVARWAAALGIMLAPSSDESTNLSRAQTGAGLLVALALGLLAAVLWRRDRVAALVAPAILLALPGVLDAAQGPGSGAAAILVMTLLVLAVDRLARPVTPGNDAPPRGGAIPAAVAWGLALGLHPGAAFLVIPLFVAYAIARPSTDIAGRERADGEVRLPRAPFSLFLLPAVGLIVFVAVWPALWAETGKRTGSWLIDTWWMFNPSYDVAGVAFDQARDRAAMGWTGFATWAGWTPVTVLLAWVFGVARLVREGRGARWFPLLAWMTLMLVGAADGGLFGGRLSLLPLLWVPTALVAAGGVAELADLVTTLWRRRRPGTRLTTGRARLLVMALVLAAPVATALFGWPRSPVGGVGDTLRRSVPLAWLREVAGEDPHARVTFTPDPDQWRPAVEAAADAAELELRWTPMSRADWVFVVGAPAPEHREVLAAATVVREGVVAGVRCTILRTARE